LQGLAQAVLRSATVRSPALVIWYRRLRLLFDSRYTWWLLLALGVARAAIFLIAYPPAHGADSTDYFLYAAQFEGLDAPIVFELIYPLYPLLIYLTHYVLGSVYWLILLQLALSALQGVVFYWGIRPYSPALAFVTALLVLADPQTGILYNFTSTEPLYMFALSLAFSVFLVQARRPGGRRLQAGDMALGVLLALVLLIRPVGRYLIVPFGVLLGLSTRSLWRTAVLGGSFALALGLFLLFNRVVFDRLELNGGGSFMLGRPLKLSGLLEADNGPASAELIALQSACPEGESLNLCLVKQKGDWPTVRSLYARAYREMLEAHPAAFARQVLDAFTDYLRQPGLQYSGELLPSDVQCADVEERTDRLTREYLEKDWILYGASQVSAETLRPLMHDITTAMCPPWPDSWTVRQAVDRVALRYRSLSRPHPYLWYAAVGAAVLLVPWARRTLPLVLIAGAVVANHAAASAVVLNVQPRYIAVVNPYKGVLLLTLAWVLGLLAVRLLDEWLARRTDPARPTAPPPVGPG
jgi:hypothetical protein